ncbi:MAG: diadenylate cyclase CdaA [Clostridia bacterium]|nr:diadenylate cyclase CdaA [Clostridia bacterium]
MTALFNIIYNNLYSFWNQVCYAVSNIRVFDIIDIAVVAFLLYRTFVFLRETRAGQLVKGIIVLLVVYALATWWKLAVLQWLLSVVFNSAIVVFAIIFQPEIRRILERVGQTKFGVTKTLGDKNMEMYDCINNVGKAARIMQESKTGALIVFERKTQLGEIINTGTIINAETSSSLLTNIFYDKAPLHDGAVIIRDGKVYAAGCILPLTQSNIFSSDLGTRHRAAIGMTENSDAIVLVVSEETGNISIVKNGEIKRNYNGVSATEELLKDLIEPELEENDRKIIAALKNFVPFGKQENKKSESEDKEDEKTDN